MWYKKSSKVPLLLAGAWPNAIPLTHVVGVRASFHYMPVPETAGQASKMQENASGMTIFVRNSIAGASQIITNDAGETNGTIFEVKIHPHDSGHPHQPN